MIASLYEGTYSVGVDMKFIPINPDDSARRGSLKLSINPFLIQDDQFTALIDAGMGLFGPEDHHAMMVKNLEHHDLEPEDIQHVYCSHLHTDHIGGLLHERFGSFGLTFPEATIWLSGRDWKKFTASAEKKGHDETVRWAHFLETHADFRFIEDAVPQPDAIQMVTIGGHTEYQQAILYHGTNEKAMMLGDVIGRPEVINRSFTAKYDFDGEKSQQVRDEYLRKALEEKYFILTYHGDNGAIVALNNFDKNKGYEVEHFTSGIAGKKE